MISKQLVFSPSKECEIGRRRTAQKSDDAGRVPNRIYTSDLASRECPAEFTINLIQGKWKMKILSLLRAGPVRLGQLQKMIPDASKKVLTENLREMEEDGLVTRTDLSDRVRHVEYSLSDSLGSALLPVIEILNAWGIEYRPKKKD